MYVTQAPEFYPYKCYITDLLTFTNEVKLSQLQSQGYEQDSKRFMEAVLTNTGWLARNAMFRKDMMANAEYRAEGKTFVGKFRHDLSGSSKPLPPKTGVYFELRRSSDDFYIMKDAADTETYKTVLTNCCLYVPIAWMQMEMLRELEVRWPKEPIVFHYRRLMVRKFGVGRNKMEFFSDSLFSEAENPIRVLMLLVESEAEIGNQGKNPFAFQRQWTTTTPSTPVDFIAHLRDQQIDSKLERMQVEMKAQVDSSMRSYMEQFMTAQQQMLQALGTAAAGNRATEEDEPLLDSRKDKGKGKGKSSQQAPPPSPPAPVPMPPPVSAPLGSYQTLKNYITRSMSRRESQVVGTTASQDEEDFDIIPDENREEIIALMTPRRRDSLPEQSTSAGAGNLPPARTEEVALGVTTKIWLTKCQLEMNSNPIGKYPIRYK
jgi:hypothetical protein